MISPSSKSPIGVPCDAALRKTGPQSTLPPTTPSLLPAPSQCPGWISLSRLSGWPSLVLTNAGSASESALPSASILCDLPAFECRRVHGARESSQASRSGSVCSDALSECTTTCDEGTTGELWGQSFKSREPRRVTRTGSQVFSQTPPTPAAFIHRVCFAQASCSTEFAHEVSSTASCELPSWDVDRDRSPINSERTPQMSAGTRRTMDNIMSAVLSSPLLEQPTVVSTGSGHVLVDACCPCLSSTDRHDRHDRRRRWMYRAPAAQGKEPIGEADTYDSDILVSNDAFSVACLLVKR